MNTPTYTISTKSIDLVARIAEKLGGTAQCNPKKSEQKGNNQIKMLSLQIEEIKQIIKRLKSLKLKLCQHCQCFTD